MDFRKLLFFLFLFFFVSSVEAVGIRGKDLSFVLDFEPNMDFEYSYQVNPTRGTTQDYVFYAIGNLEEYISFIPERLNNVHDYENPSFRVKISFPDSMEPGLHRQRICVGETGSAGTGAISVRTAACASIHVLEVYPDVYLISEFTSTNANIGDPIYFEISVQNWGEPEITSLYAEIDIMEGQKKLETVSTTTISLASRESGILTASLDTSNYNAGNYNAVARLKYAGREDILESSFRVGNLSVNILNYTTISEISSINEFFVEVESGWNTKIDNIYAEVKVSKNGQELTSFRTVSESLEPWARKKLIGYLDTRAISSLGEYDVLIDVYFMDAVESTFGKLQIIESTKERRELDMTTLFIGAAIVIIIILLSLLVKNKNEKKK